MFISTQIELLNQGGDCCYGSAKPKCGKGDWTERGDGINQPSSLLNFTIRLVVTKPLLALVRFSLVVLGEVHQQGQQVQSARQHKI